MASYVSSLKDLQKLFQTQQLGSHLAILLAFLTLEICSLCKRCAVLPFDMLELCFIVPGSFIYSNVMALNPRVFLHISFSNQLTSTRLESALGRQWNPNLWQMILEERRLCEKMLERPLRVGFEHVGTNPHVCPHASNMCKQYHIPVT